jgi:4-amino-4-deoxy-L-arabinose transferase-like glycosyltransferase
MKRLKALFFLFVFIQGFIYLFIIPPWQSPDETHFFGYGIMLSENAELRSEEHEQISRDIMESMAVFHSWKYTNLVKPEKFPKWLGRLDFYGSMFGLYRSRAPLYYSTVALIINKLKIKDTISQFYVVRGFSFFLFMLTVCFTYLSAKLVFKNHMGYALTGVCLAGMLPQFLIISTSVNPANLVVFLASLFLYVILYSLYKGKHLWALLLGPLIIALGVLTHRAALFMIPPFLVYLLVLFIQSFKERRKVFKYLVILIVLVIVIIGLYLAFSHVLPDSVLERVDRESGMKQLKSQWNRFAQYFTEGISKDTSRSVYWFMDGLFKSFWFFAGWLRFGYLADIYSIFMMASILSGIGIFKYIFSYFRKKEISFDFRVFLILIALVLPIILGTLIHSFPKHYAPQGRYIFPAISAIAILFVLGLKEITPKKWERWVPLFVIFGFMVLNIYTIFHPLIRAFYFFRNF